MTSQIDEQIINCFYYQFHNKEDGYNIFEDTPEYKFGLLNLVLNSTPMTKKLQMIHSKNDMSGSMIDLCKDNRTKMFHLNHTIKNITSLLSNHSDNINVLLEIFGFDDKIQEVLSVTKITKDEKLVNTIHSKIDSILKPRGMTDIYKALKNSKEQLDNIDEKVHYKSHIFMTDGVITSGSTDTKILFDLLNPENNNIFVGIGIEHDTLLLQHLASIKNGSYYYVDNIENAGLVFGEIIHSILYPALMNSNITVNNGEIYDFKNNTWVNKMELSTIVSEANKQFHIRTKTPELFELLIDGNTENGYLKEKCDLLPDLLDDEGKIGLIDLTKFMYRQTTLELLYQTILLSKGASIKLEEKEVLKQKLKNFLAILLTYKDTLTSMDDIEFIKILSDDIYITLKTFNSEKSILYSSIRHQTQGNERCYNITNIENTNTENTNLQPLTRQYGNTQYDDDENDILEYEISSSPLNSRNTSQTQQYVMREVSYRRQSNTEEI